MKRSRIFTMALAILMLFALFSGCKKDGEADSQNPQDTSITVTDMKDREITIDGPAQKIVAVTAAECEILYAIGAGDLLVGRGEHCKYPEEALDVTSVNSGSETNIEQIIALSPDVVLMSTMDQKIETVHALEDAGIAVVVSEAVDIEGVYEAITLIGAVTGHNSEALELVNSMKAAFKDITVSEPSGKTVYFEVSPLEYGLWTAGADTFMDEVAELIGLTNIFSDISGWGEISQEQIIERNPDYIVTIAMYSGTGPLPDEEIASRDGWSNITAVKEGQIFLANSDELSRPGPRLADAAVMLHDFVYGD